MIKTATLLAALASLLVTGCAGLQTTPNLLPAGTPLKTGSIDTKPKGTPVVVGRSARLYVWAAFMEKDCRPIAANVALAQAPAKGTVSFRSKSSVIQHSLSGRCVGQRIDGTGVYYTPNAGQEGADQFVVTATSPSGQPVSRTFQVRIVDRQGPSKTESLLSRVDNN